MRLPFFTAHMGAVKSDRYTDAGGQHPIRTQRELGFQFRFYLCELHEHLIVLRRLFHWHLYCGRQRIRMRP